MPKTYIFEGNTTNAAIEKGLRELKVSKKQVDIRVIEENKKSFFSILAPRIVKVEFTLKDDIKIEDEKVEFDSKSVPAQKNIRKVLDDDVEKQITILKQFVGEFIEKLPTKEINYEIMKEKDAINVIINGENLNYLIGYRAENMYALQNILNAISNKNVNNGARVNLNINGYREKREEVLNNLAIKLSKTVIRTGKSVTLEPMNAYERKIIHSKLQNSDKVETHSVGKEPYRKIVISLKK